MSRSSEEGGTATGRRRDGQKRTAGGVEAAVEVDGAKDRLQRRGQNGLARASARRLFAAPQPESGPQLQVRRPAGQVGAGDQRRALGRQHADRRLRIRGQEVLGHDQRQGRIAEQRQRLVVGGRRVLVGKGGVGQRALEKGGIVEVVAEPSLEPGDVTRVHPSGAQRFGPARANRDRCRAKWRARQGPSVDVRSRSALGARGEPE
ncbi:MAG: hypothetical protein AUG00_04365 [Candidatus Rokubacteria bacterium 13_1_20CM_2_70_7]|nr:MAG: hypothetical protein AUG00_04365 [Candidatus Rokubacteria bacterium 13_1_20CM_2_70_7]